MKEKGNTCWLALVGYVFFSIVSIFSALQTKQLVLELLLVLSAVVSLILAITRLSSSKKMIARIKDLEDNQLSVGYDDGTFIIEKGKTAQKSKSEI